MPSLDVDKILASQGSSAQLEAYLKFKRTILDAPDGTLIELVSLSPEFSKMTAPPSYWVALFMGEVPASYYVQRAWSFTRRSEHVCGVTQPRILTFKSAVYEFASAVSEKLNSSSPLKPKYVVIEHRKDHSKLSDEQAKWLNDTDFHKLPNPPRVVEVKEAPQQLDRKGKTDWW